MPRFKRQESALRRLFVADRLITGCLLTLTAIAIATALSYLRMPLIPFVLAVFLTYIIAPMVEFFERKLHFPRWLALTSTFGLTVIALVLLAFFVLGNLRGLIASADDYKARLIFLADSVARILSSYSIPVDPQDVTDSLRAFPLFATLRQAAGQLVHIVTSGFLVLIFLFFLLSGSGRLQHQSGIYNEIEVKIRQYLATKLATSAATGILVGATLAVLGVDLAFMFGFLTFLLNFIPTLGSIIATLLPIPIALLQFDSPGRWLLVLCIPSAIQITIGNIIEPKILGHSLDLHPAAVLLALTFWGIIWGPVGMFLAVPIVVVLKIAMARFPATKAIAELLAGRLPFAQESV